MNRPCHLKFTEQNLLHYVISCSHLVSRPLKKYTPVVSISDHFREVRITATLIVGFSLCLLQRIVKKRLTTSC